MKMKQKSRPIKWVILCLVLCIVYFFISSRPLGSELQFIPQWTIQVTSRSAYGDPAGMEHTGYIPFKLGQNMGYVSPDGMIYNMTSFPFKAAISPYYYASYGSDASQIPFYAANGTEHGIINGTGFPYFSDNFIYLFHPGGNSVAEYDQTGSLLWQFDGITPILAFSASQAGAVIGFADGIVAAFDHAGKQITQFEPGGSDYSIILGAAISDSGEYIACVSGIQKQRFVLTRQTGSIAKIVFHEFLPQDQYTPVFIMFSQDEDTVYFNYHDGLGVLSCTDGRFRHLPVQGQILDIVEFKEQDLLFALSYEDGQYHVYTIEKEANLIGKFSFAASAACIAGDGSSLYIGRDTSISRLDIQRR